MRQQEHIMPPFCHVLPASPIVSQTQAQGLGLNLWTSKQASEITSCLVSLRDLEGH